MGITMIGTIFLDEENDITAKINSGKNKRDVLSLLFPNISVTIQYLNSAHDRHCEVTCN